MICHMDGITLSSYEKEMTSYFEALHDDSFQYVACPLCSGHDYYKLFNKGCQLVVRCQCQMVYSRRQPKPEVLKEFYEKSKAMSEWSELKKTDPRNESKFSTVKEFIQDVKPSRVLDIGCGNGDFLAMVRDWCPSSDVHGVDAHQESIDVAASKGLKVTQGDMLTFTEEKWDLVTLWGGSGNTSSN